MFDTMMTEFFSNIWGITLYTTIIYGLKYTYLIKNDKETKKKKRKEWVGTVEFNEYLKQLFKREIFITFFTFQQKILNFQNKLVLIKN